MAGALPGPAASAATVGAAARSSQAQVAVLDLVMLVDESGSETPQKVAQEKAAASEIAQSMLNESSRVTVIGFGGVNHVTGNQNPTDIVCRPTIASQQNLDYLASCVDALHQRTEAEGDDTDYNAALSLAMSYLSPGSTVSPPSPAKATKIILMMTDGAVDVHRDTQTYGTNWKLGETTDINEQLAQARQGGVQFWSLGFGTDIGTGVTQPQALAYLNQMSAEGAPATCGGPSSPQPHATWINNPDDVYNAVNTLYSDATCIPNNGPPPGPGPGPGEPRTLRVDIPAIASSAAISVRRGNPDIAVTFYPPNSSTPWADATAISGADSDSPVEVLHLPDITSSADVGTWRMVLTAPVNLTSQLVSATVFWQGAVRAVLGAPPQVDPGKQVNVTVTVLGPTGPVTDPETLKSLLVGVSVTGDGLPGAKQVSLGVGGGPGIYAGSFTAPDQRGALTVTSSAVGYGLFVTENSQTVTVGITPAFTAVPSFSGPTTVTAGDTVTGLVSFTNTTGASKQVGLDLISSVTGAKLTSPVGPVTVPSGSPRPVSFTVTIGKDVPKGTAVLVMRTTDPASGTVYDATQPLVITVIKPPGVLGQLKSHWWQILLGLLLIALIIAFILRRRAARRHAIDVQDLVATLRLNGEQKGLDLKAEPKWADVFAFVINERDTPDPHLALPDRGWTGPVYQVRRSGPGLVRLLAPTRIEPYEDIEVGGAGALLDGGLELSFQDKRRRRVARSSSPDGPLAGAGLGGGGGYENYGGGSYAGLGVRPSGPPSANGSDDTLTMPSGAQPSSTQQPSEQQADSPTKDLWFDA